MALVKCPCAFRLRRLAQNGCRGISVRHFSCKCPHKMALVKCPLACRLRRLAHNGCRRISARHFSCKSHTIWLMWHVHLHFDCGGSHKTKHLIQESCHETFYGELVQRSCPRDLLWRSCSEILPRDLLQRSCQQSPYRSCTEILPGASYRDLVQRPGEESSDLSQRSFIRAWTEILLWGPSQRSSVKVSYRVMFSSPASSNVF